MLKQANSKDTPNAISSQESESGARPCDSQGGPTTDLFGAEVAPVKTTASQGKAKAQAVTGTYGRYLPASSESESLTKSLVSRLARQFDSVGSTVYEQTWKRKRTPSGVLFWEHTARARTTSGSDCSGVGWTTPQAHDSSPRGRGQKAKHGSKHGCADLNADAETAGWQTPMDMSKGGSHGRGGKRKGEMLLAGQAELCAGWPTPIEDDANNATRLSGQCQSLTRTALLTAGRPTPRSSESNESTETQEAREARGTKASKNLDSIAQMAGWPTCSARDHKDTPGMATTGTNPDGSERSRLDQLPRVAHLTSGKTPDGTNAATGKPDAYRLNPGFSLWLMLGPTRAIAWLRCAELAMQSISERRQRS
jgi:hypothetical protein